MIRYRLNVEQISSIESHENSICWDYKYRSAERKNLPRKDSEGYYSNSCENGPLTVSEIENNGRLFCKNEVVYFKPFINVVMKNKEIHKIFFKSMEEMNIVINKLLPNGFQYND